ncbi:type VI secretion system protein ImpK [Pseudomonas aeruginosa]|uniref:DotU family type IV/VI secretion system protein n=1 Tax=Pseudomonas aeruginosa TaxID=287 RepID=UPI00071BB112|nr:DotU/TssL family secretion system protein [Pseudomonas aeruginosa]KSL44762.1 type VI secretion system protein ImpK [Pseudomonas aeruginosa]
MPEGSAGPFSQAYQEQPLSTAFRQAWQEWLEAWGALDRDAQDVPRMVERALELSTRITRRLWRSAFASVGDAAGVQVKAMVYAFVALVDETLVFSAWPGQGAWQDKPLESHLYGSRQAGEYLPLAIKRLLDERAPASRDLANVYLQCLILGFRGRLRGPRGEALHEKWRQALFAFAWQREADAADLARRLEQPAAAPPRRLPVRAALPDGFRLGLAVLGLVLLMSGIGHLFWRDIQHEMAAVTHLADAEQAP